MAGWQGLIAEGWQAFTEDWWVKVSVALIAALVALLFRGVRRWLGGFATAATRLLHSSLRIERALAEVRDGSGWRQRQPEFPENYRLRMAANKCILTVANLKGGVGKTTIAVNLGAHFARRGERVLMIDLDFQGSMSSMLLPLNLRLPVDGGRSLAATFISGEVAPQLLLQMPKNAPQLPGVHVVPAYYDLASFENELMFRWLLKDVSHDARYALANALLSDEFTGNFDRVIIDAPPRLTAGSIQALCASTHVLIPTVLDRLSGEAVGTFVDQILEFKKAGVCPHINILGVVGSLTHNNIGARLEEEPDSRPNLLGAEREGLAAIEQALSRAQREHGLTSPPAELLPPEVYVQRLTSISQQAGIGPATSDVVQAMFQRLGLEVARRMDIYVP